LKIKKKLTVIEQESLITSKITQSKAKQLTENIRSHHFVYGTFDEVAFDVLPPLNEAIKN
jgi:hypothetical protein